MTKTYPRGEKAMFTGLLGDVVDAMEPHTEADGTAIAAQFLVAFGVLLGRGPVVHVGETAHHMNEFLIVTGRTSRARKGDGKNAAFRVLEAADPDFGRITASGLSSAEGLIYHVRDQELGLDKDGNQVIKDPGVDDKRLLAVETEFASVLKRFQQQGNTLSPLLRDVWDGKSPLRTLTKNSPLKATDAHTGVIVHMTEEDLHRYFDDVDLVNGLGNRFPLLLTERARLIPDPPRVPAHVIDGLARRTRVAIEYGQQVGALRWTPDGLALWREIYPHLSRDLPGLVGAMLARAEAHVLRLSSLYSLLSQSQEIGAAHLESALALWDVVEASVKAVFSGRTGNRNAERIRDSLLPGQSMTLTEIQNVVFKNHLLASQLSDAIRLLVELDEVRIDREPGDGRDAVVVTRRPEGGWSGPEAAKEANKAKEAPRTDS